jgi:hypothetical protein
MSHPDPSYDFDNSYDDDAVFYGEDSSSYHPDAEHEVESNFDDNDDEDLENEEYDYYDDSMDGDFDSAMRDAGFGTDEDYGYYGEDY